MDTPDEKAPQELTQAADLPPQDESMEPPQQPERPPLSGVMARIGALMVDVIFIYFIGYLLDRSFRAPLLNLNPWLPWLGHVVIFFYLWLSDGPVGQGCTLGRTLLKMRVVDMAGNPLGIGASFLRALVKQLVFLPLVIFVANRGDASLYSLVAPVHWQLRLELLITLAVLVCLAMAIAQVFAASLDPLRRSWADLLARSLVTSEVQWLTLRDQAPALAEKAATPQTKLKIRFSFILAAVAAVALAYQPISTWLKPAARRSAAQMTALREQSALAPYLLTVLHGPDPKRQVAFQGNVIMARSQAQSAGKEVPTTDTLRSLWLYDGTGVFMMALRRTGSGVAADIESPAMLQAFEQVSRQAWETWQTSKQDAPPEVAALPDPAEFCLLLVEPFQFLVYRKDRFCYVVKGAANPEGGPLRAEPYAAAHPTQPATGDTPTTGTVPAPSAATQ